MAKHFSLTFIFIFVMAFSFAMICPYASAEVRLSDPFSGFSDSSEMSRETFAHWMGVALQASNIAAQSTLPVVAPVADFIVDPFNIEEDLIWQPIEYAFPLINVDTPSETLENYLQRSSIMVRGDVITIDGIDYRDIWVTNDAAQALRTNVLDLETAFNIASNSNGNFVSGVGSIDGLPAFSVNDLVRTQSTVISGPNIHYQFGNHEFYIGSGGNGLTIVPGYENIISSRRKADPSEVYYYYRNSYVHVVALGPDGNSGDSIISSSFASSPFDFTWVSQTIPASVLPSDDGLHMYVPTNPDQFSDPEVKQNIRNFNLNITNNFEFDNSIHLGTENNYHLFDNLFDHIADIGSGNVVNQFGPYEYPPVPTPTPVPTEPVPWPTIPPTPVPTPTPEPTTPPEPTPSPEPTTPPEPTPVPTSPIGDTPYSVLDDGIGRLGDKLDQGFHGLIDNFATAEADFFGDIVDILAEAFKSLMELIRSVTHIWAYVVGWIGNISVPFNWSLSALGSAGSYFLSPFAAIAAFSVIIAIYKRFGR